MWKILVSGPNLPLQQRVLAMGATLVLGRATDNDIILPSDFVSRRHAQLRVTNEGLRVSDLGSSNGTLLNGQILGAVSREVSAGDAVSIGDYVVKVEATAAPRRTAVHQDGFITLRASELAENPFMTRCNARRPSRPRTEAELPGDSQYAPLLFELAERLASGPELGLFLGEVLDCALAVTDFEGTLLLMDAQGGFSPWVGAREEVGSLGSSWSTTILRAAQERRCALFVNHLRSDARFNAAHSVILASHLHVLCAPLISKEETLGAIYLATRSAAAPSQEAVDFVAAIAQLAATALEHARRKESAASMSTLPEISTPIRRIDNTAQGLQGMLDALESGLSGEDAAVPAEAIRALLAEARHAVQRISGDVAQVVTAVKRLDAA